MCTHDECLETPPNFCDYHAKLLDDIFVSQLLAKLTDKERETITLWANGETLKYIAIYIGNKYDHRNETNPLSGCALGFRIKKIIKKLKRYAQE